MLDFELRLPPAPRDGAPLLVLLHGRGSDRHDLVGLQTHLVADALLVTPDGPHEARPWGYGPGKAWYRYLGENRPDPATFEQSLQALELFLTELPARLPVRPGPLVMGGFSQGGTMSLAYALTHPGQVPLVVNFSGFLPDHPRVRVQPETVQGSAFFWGHGFHDQAVHFQWAVQGRDLLRQAGADLEARDYNMGHTISEEELAQARAWLTRQLMAGDPDR